MSSSLTRQACASIVPATATPTLAPHVTKVYCAPLCTVSEKAALNRPELHCQQAMAFIWSTFSLGTAFLLTLQPLSKTLATRYGHSASLVMVGSNWTQTWTYIFLGTSLNLRGLRGCRFRFIAWGTPLGYFCAAIRSSPRNSHLASQVTVSDAGG